MAEEQLVLFSLGNVEYAISIAQVKEIIQYKGANKLPNSPGFMEGIINLRGKIIPVIDLARRLNLTTAGNADKRALIIESEGREIGIVVDAVTEVIRIQDNAIEPPPQTSAAEYIRGIGKAGDRLLILLDVDKLFSGDTAHVLKKAG